MIRGKCPICSRTFEIKQLAELPSFPFCSERCRLVDLGRWIDGVYVVPGTPGSAAGAREARPDAADEAE